MMRGMMELGLWEAANTRTRGKSVRHVPGLKCQTCPRPFIMPHLPSTLLLAGSLDKTVRAYILRGAEGADELMVRAIEVRGEG
jgi:hypothetical protein